MPLQLQELELRLWSAANALRGTIDPADFKTYTWAADRRSRCGRGVGTRPATEAGRRDRGIDHLRVCGCLRLWDSRVDGSRRVLVWMGPGGVHLGQKFVGVTAAPYWWQ